MLKSILAVNASGQLYLVYTMKQTCSKDAAFNVFKITCNVCS